jgi:hypothetical protein
MSFIHVRAYMFVKHERPCVGPKTRQTCTRIQKVRQTSQPGFAPFKRLKPLKGSSNKKTFYSTRSCVNWAFFGTRGPKKPNLHTNSLNKLLCISEFLFFRSARTLAP